MYLLFVYIFTIYFTMHYALFTMHYALFTMHYALCTIDYLYIFIRIHYFMLKIKPTSPHACACFSPYLEFCFSFFNFPELMQFAVIIIVIIIFDFESF